MKTVLDETVEIITPCFCAGADPAQAEIRVPSIRGELRWWCRALGYSRLERELFGGISTASESEQGTSSRVVIRVSSCTPATPIDLPKMKINQPLSYLLYYANQSGKQKEQPYGPRFSAEGMLAPETTFRLQVLQKGLSDEWKKILDEILSAFLNLGALGYRSTRACGALFCEAVAPANISEWEGWAKHPNGIRTARIMKNGVTPVAYSSWSEVMKAEELVLRAFRKQYPAGKYGDKPSPLGVSTSREPDIDRQSSALRLRPVKIDGSLYAGVVYSASGLHSRMGTLDSLCQPLENGCCLEEF